MRERTLPGAPGVYPAAAGPAPRTLAGVRMDVAAFVGVAPRGPCRLPALEAPWAEPPSGPEAPARPRRSVAVPVESWDAYRRLFGGFEGPGLLPYAVAAFFEQGGVRCHVVRIVHDHGPGAPGNDHGVALGPLPGVTVRGTGAPPTLRARDEGSWGNALGASLRLRARPLPVDDATAAEVTVPRAAALPVGTLLRLRLPDGSRALRFVTATREEWAADRPAVVRRATLEAPLPEAPDRVEVVEGEVSVTDGSRDRIPRDELHERVGLHPDHPRWLAAVLHRDSLLLRPDPAWIDVPLDPADAALRPSAAPPAPQFRCGRDRWAEVEPDDFFDDGWDPRGGVPGDGVHALAEAEEVALVCVPDLYSPGPLAPPRELPEPAPTAGPTFEPCVDLPAPAPPPPAAGPCPGGHDASDDGSGTELDGLRLDPALDLDDVAALQERLVGLAERLASWVVLLDVPPGLDAREALEWRSRFASAWGAAFHPWLRVARPDDEREPLVSVPPSAFAAGIAARREIVFGVPHGPANELAAGAVAVSDPVPETAHAGLHRAGINLFVPERDGVRLTAARTLSLDPAWRQLSVRRLMTLLGRTLRRRMQWTVFEPNGPELRDELRRLLEAFLRRLFADGAFRGRTPAESYFVRCDDALNPPAAVDAGRLVCHVGVAPAEPLEFIVLRLTREGDGTLLLEE